MLDIAEELKNIYRNDLIPLVPQNVPKELTLFFPDLNLTIETDRIVDDSFELSERLCSTDDITLGACEGAMVKLTVANLIQDLSGYSFILTQTVDGTYQMPLGSYKVDSCKKQNDLWFREITAYDDMKKTDTDVVVWYNSLTWPQTVKSMRESLLTYLSIGFEDQTLTNDSVQLTKTINPASLVGRDVLRCLCMLNGGFGHINRQGKFKIIQLSGLGLYPSETLYPEDDLFPAESSETMTAGFKPESYYEEYIVEPITQVQIKQEDGDVGVTVGDPGNLYVISENFLLYGKTAAELETIADNILLQIKNKYYRPHNTVCIGLPYIEVGDALTIITGNDAIETFVFTRTLKGIQALEDEFAATGNQKRNNKVSLATQVEQLKGRALKIIKSIDELSSTMTDLEQNVSSQFQQTASSIALKVDKSGVVAAINLSPEAAKIQAENIQFEGLVTANNNFKILLDGSIEAKNGKFSGTINSAIVNSPYIIGGTILGSLFRSNLDDLDPDEAYMTLDASTLDFYADGGTHFLSIGHAGIHGYHYSAYGNIRDLLISPSSSEIESYSIKSDYLYEGNYRVVTTNTMGSQTAGAVKAGGSLGLFTISPGGGFISYAGASKDNPSGFVYIGAQTVQAATIQQISDREAKEHIELYTKNAIELIRNTPIQTYTLKDNKEDTKPHVGVIIDEAPDDIIGSGGKTISLYDMISVAWKAIQEQQVEIEELKSLNRS